VIGVEEQIKSLSASWKLMPHQNWFHKGIDSNNLSPWVGGSSSSNQILMHDCFLCYLFIRSIFFLTKPQFHPKVLLSLLSSFKNKNTYIKNLPSIKYNIK